MYPYFPKFFGGKIIFKQGYHRKLKKKLAHAY